MLTSPVYARCSNYFFTQCVLANSLASHIEAASCLWQSSAGRQLEWSAKAGGGHLAASGHLPASNNESKLRQGKNDLQQGDDRDNDSDCYALVLPSCEAHPGPVSLHLLADAACPTQFLVTLINYVSK